MTVRALWVVVLAVASLMAVYLVRDRAAARELPPVLVATHHIPAGTPGRVVVARKMVVVTRVPADVGAIADPSYLVGRVVLHDLSPGDQVNALDISAAP
jgi:hypothetical protein